MVNALDIDRDSTSVATYVRKYSADKRKARISAGINTTFTVPAGVSLAIFATQANFWCGINEEPILPTLATETVSTGELNPTSFQVEENDVINIKTRTDTDFGISYYA